MCWSSLQIQNNGKHTSALILYKYTLFLSIQFSKNALKCCYFYYFTWWCAHIHFKVAFYCDVSAQSLWCGIHPALFILYIESPVLVAEDEQEQKSLSGNKTVRQLTLERDQAIADLNSVERSFADLFRRYENMKGVLEGFKKVSRASVSHEIQPTATY